MDSDKITIYMARHAPVIGQKGRVYGDHVEISLDNQHDKIQHLSIELPNTDEAVWYCSGVDRTVRTIQAIMEDREDNIDVIKSSFFKEQNFGDLVGKTHEEAKDHIQWINGLMFAPNPPNGDTIEELIDRVNTGLQSSICEAIKLKKKNIVIVCHRGTIRAANIILHNLSPENFLDINIDTLDFMKWEHTS